MKALSIKSDREIWLVDVAATSPVSPTVTVQGTQKNSRTLPVRIYRVNTKEGYDDSSPGSFF